MFLKKGCKGGVIGLEERKQKNLEEKKLLNLTQLDSPILYSVVCCINIFWLYRGRKI
jgi:hypothetical protein